MLAPPLGADQHYELIHVDLDGTIFWHGNPTPMICRAVNGKDGSIWGVYYDEDGTLDIVHLSVDAAPLSRTHLPVPSVARMALDPTDGSCWADGYHIAADGTLLGNFSLPPGLRDFTTGTFWDSSSDPWLIHDAADGHELGRTGGVLMDSIAWDEGGQSLWAWRIPMTLPCPARRTTPTTTTWCAWMRPATSYGTFCWRLRGTARAR